MTGPTPRTIAAHLSATLARVQPLGTVHVPLDAGDVLGLVLARDVLAAAPVPAFDNSAMDGYAVRRADLPDDGREVTLPVLADVRPGSPTVVGAISGPNRPGSDRESGQKSRPQPAGVVRRPAGVVRIMTGAPLPDGFDAVVPVERTSTGRFVAGRPTTERTVTLARQPRDHVRRAGTDLAAGDLVAAAGTVVTPGTIATAAAAGRTTLPVHRRPRVAVISTGSELAGLGTASPGTIPDSNSLMLAALARAAGADVVRVGAVPDDAGALAAALDGVVGTGTGGADLVVTSGGVSAGASDVVREVLAAGSAQDVDVAAVAMRPGRPQALATWRGVPWVAVPGNPVSALVSFTLFARPAVRRLAGHDGPPPDRTVRVARGWASPPGAEQVLPVVTGPDGVAPAARDGHHLSALPAADALAIVPAEVTQVAPGDEVTVRALGDPT
ncbi:molybdopterin molybdochelatase [Isoptericola sp. CG 20/1183]|uniref:Molybdopterin molybdenumtransferase n=1 Tax=Isoptericola halotolerans TaxID=300560 RepID=A0ABX5ECK7_9MICO|nr:MULTISPECIES: molybdopterin molybdotransferase MoeA [Isoptericola]PRZ04807.1 molybdopterin molybdochelatase [Isoptericola halotolerans]PRZ05298.1 molybdopterin molybdochelatase [Isoptericola sp. CG 20/1183]